MKLGEQIESAKRKNEEIQSVNAQLGTEISQSVQMMDKYTTEISTYICLCRKLIRN